MNSGVSSRLAPRGRNWLTAILIASLSLLSTACAHPAKNDAKAQVDKPVTSKLMKALRQVSLDGLKYNGKPASSPLSRISGPPVSGLKPGILYMGADFCPYCASLRWPLVLALLRFGNFQGLRYMRSSSSDVYSSTITFSFHGAQYDSSYLAFQSVELADRAGKRLETPDSHQSALFKKFDAPPYTSSPGGIPFLYIGGHYLETGAPFSPGLLKNLSWQKAVNQIRQKNTKLSRQVLGATNLYTAALCKITNGEPAKVCSAPAVKTAAGHLPQVS